jgi:hypothetical protein
MARCADCGFLSVRSTSTHDLHEVRANWRETGGVPREYISEPRCFVRAIRLEDERPSPETGEQSGFVEIIGRERNCPKFFPWMQGYNPRDHLDMLHEKTLRELEAKQRERDQQWQAEQRQKDKEWQEEQRRQDAEHQRQQKEEERRWQEAQKRRDRIWQAFYLFVGAALGVAVPAFANFLKRLFGE